MKHFNVVPGTTAGMLREEYTVDRKTNPTFLLLIDTSQNLKALYELATLHAHGKLDVDCDATYGHVPDDSLDYYAVTHDGTRDGFWHAITRLAEHLLRDAGEPCEASGAEPGMREFNRMVTSYGLPPVRMLTPPDEAGDGASAM
ncbi:hypothetical protein [Corynebacterium aquatimens]|uniref:Uncharacterized protein n=1 Tax=Corynebacterium aquatimens TaxID=1190508 RepID=A0A931DZ41_9CORY|nr:hypothetical protein [Corynebacterium aquatimens]MBG6121343.1 hypothetical protein [Corynebacterium aquatimens]WJY66110.1 hypothetical protein CAQUA_07060 [Corynebacterium aquatimens]